MNRIGAVLGAVAVVVGMAGCSSGPTPAEARESAAALRAAMQVNVKYEVEGDPLTYGDKKPYADVTMKRPTGTTQSSPDLPMTVEGETVPGLTMPFTAGDFVYLSVQNNGSTQGVTCRISTDDGKVISENSSSSSYGIATCEGRAQ